MLEIATAVGVVALFVACIVLAGYIVFLPLARTIVGGVQLLKIYALRRCAEADLGRAFGSIISDPELGPTMADGGEKAEKENKGTVGKEP